MAAGLTDKLMNWGDPMRIIDDFELQNSN